MYKAAWLNETLIREAIIDEKALVQSEIRETELMHVSMWTGRVQGKWRPKLSRYLPVYGFRNLAIFSITWKT